MWLFLSLFVYLLVRVVNSRPCLSKMVLRSSVEPVTEGGVFGSGLLSPECVGLLQESLFLGYDMCDIEYLDLYMSSGLNSDDPMQLVLRHGEMPDGSDRDPR